MSIDWESEIKAPQEAILDLPQERITGDILRGRGPRRGNLERLIKYWRPIMRKPGGFRRCLVILADHPELYPLQRICAWLHHETTGLWPNEGNHHEGGKLGPIVGRARRSLKKPKKRKKRGKKSLDGSDLISYEYSFKDMITESRSFNGILVQPIAGRQNVLEAKAAMFSARLDEVADRKDEIRVKRVGIVGSNSAAGQAIQAVGSILLPGDISDFRSPVRSQIYETLTPGGGRGLGLRRVVRGAGRGARNKYRCPPGFQKGGTFTNKFYSTCGAQILGIPSFGPGAFTTGIERALASLARDASLVRSIGDLKNNSNPYDIIRAAQIPFAPKKTSPTRRQTSVDLVLARIANGENVPTRFVRRDGVILEPKVSFEELGKLDEFDDMVDGSLITKYNDGILGQGSIGTFGTGIRDNYISLDEGVIKISREGGELDQGVKDRTFRAFNAAVAKNTGRNPDRTAPLMDFINTSDGKFTVEFGEIRNNSFIPDNTAKNELVQVRSGGVTKLVPKWVYDTFLSRSAPRRLDNDPVYELIDGEEKSVSPFFNAKHINKEDFSLARDYFRLVNEKTANFTRLLGQVEMDVKAPRLGRAARRAGRGAGRGLRGSATAIFDNALGRFRCPPGTRRGGTFSDRLGSNCGYSLPANIVDNLSKATNAVRNISRKGRGRKEKADRASNGIARLNEKLEEVLNITESRSGRSLGRTIGQRRSIGSLTPDQEKYFSGQSTRDTLDSLKNDINDVIENGTRGEIEGIWEGLTKLANLEAGRLTDNTSTDERVERAGRQIQDLLDNFSLQIIRRGDATDTGIERKPRETVAELRENLQQRYAASTEKLKRLSRNIIRGRRMRRTSDDIGDITSAIFYNEDGTLNEPFLNARRNDVKEQAVISRDNLKMLLVEARAVGGSSLFRNQSDDQIDEMAVDFLKSVADVDYDPVDKDSAKARNVHARIMSELNTFREMRDLIADDDASPAGITDFTRQFEDALRRINTFDRNNLLSKAGMRRDSDSEPQVDNATLRSLQDNPLGLESRYGITNFKKRLKARAQNKRTEIRQKIDKALYRNYVNGTTVNATLRDSILDNPNLPSSVSALATVPWQDHGRLVALRNQEKLALYKNVSETMPNTPEGNAARAALYKSTGIYVAPDEDWNNLGVGDTAKDIFRQGILGGAAVASRRDARIKDFVNKMLGNVDVTDADGNTVNTSGVKLKGTFTVLGPDGPVEVERFVKFDPDGPMSMRNIVKQDRYNDDRIDVDTVLSFELRRKDNGEVIYTGTGAGNDWERGGLQFNIDFSSGEANFETAGLNVDTRNPHLGAGFSAGYRPVQRLGVDQDISFADGGFFGQMVERVTPFLVGNRITTFGVSSTAYSGQATWVRYGLRPPQGTNQFGINTSLAGNIVNDADAAISKITRGDDLNPSDVAALTIVGTPEKLEELRILQGALEDGIANLTADTSVDDLPDSYSIYSLLVGLDSNGDLNKSSALYRAMTGSDTQRRVDDPERVKAEIDNAMTAFGGLANLGTFDTVSDDNVRIFEEYGDYRRLPSLASESLELDVSDLTVALEEPEQAIAGEMATELSDIRRRLNPNVPRDAYGNRLDSIDKRHSALMTEEERSRSAASIDRVITKLTNEGVLGEDDEEVSNLLNLAAELRNSSDFPEETRGTDNPLDNIAVDLGDEVTLQALIDDVDSLIEEVDTPADLENLKKVLQGALDAPSGRVASKDVTKPDNDATPNFFDKFSKVFKGRKFRTNFFKNDDESDANAQIAGQLTIFDELNAQTDRTNEVARRGIDAIMEQVSEVAQANSMTPEEVVERAVAHALRDTDFTPAPPVGAPESAVGLPVSPVSEMTFSQGKIQDMRLMNHTLKTMLSSMVNRPEDDDFNIFQDPTILEDGTLIGRTNPDGSLITRAQAIEMLQAVTRFDERLEGAYNFFDDRSTPAPLVLAETEEDLDQLITAFSLQSNVPGDDYLMMRMSNLAEILDETKARRNRPEGRNMLSTSALGGRREITAGNSPTAPQVREWVESSGFQVNPDLDEQIYSLRTDEGLSVDEVAQRLGMDRFEVRVREAEHKQKLSTAKLDEDRVTRNTSLEARRVDAFDADRAEVEEVLVEQDGLPPAADAPQAGLPEDFNLEELVNQTTQGGIPIPSPETPADEADVDVNQRTTVGLEITGLDDLLTSLENRVNSLQAAIERVASNDRGSRTRRPRRPRSPRGPRGEAYDRLDPRVLDRRYDEMSIDELLAAVGIAGSPFNGWQSTWDERAMSALRRRLRTMSDEELLDLYNRRGSRRLPGEFIPIDGAAPDTIGEAITNAAQSRGVVPINRLELPDIQETLRLINAPESGGAPTPPPTPDDLSFQNRVWNLRTNGLDVEEAADILGVDRGLVRQAEVNYARTLDRADFDEAMARARLNTRRREGRMVRRDDLTPDEAAEPRIPREIRDPETGEMVRNPEFNELYEARLRRRRRRAEARQAERQRRDERRERRTRLSNEAREQRETEERLWDLRTRQGYTIEEAAEELGIDRVEARNIEVGYSRRLTPDQRERDYERGRVAAEIRQSLGTADAADTDELADRAAPPVTPPQSDGTPATPPRDSKEVFDEIISVPDFKFR